jgi:hypothetical protein
MTLQSSGPISMFDVNTELGYSNTAQIGLLDTMVRGLFAVPTGQVGLFDGYGKHINTYSGTLSGSGSLAIPGGTTIVSLTGRGGVGGTTAGTAAVYGWDWSTRTDTYYSETQTPFGSNQSSAPTSTSASAPSGTGYTTSYFWYYESQAAVAAFAGSGYHAAFAGSGYHPYVAAVAATAVTYKWDLSSRHDYYDGWSSIPFGGIGYPSGPTAAAPTQSYYTTTAAYCGASAGGGYDLYHSVWWAMVDQPATSGSAAVEAYWDSPPYAAYWDFPPTAAIPAYYYQYGSSWSSYQVSASVAGTDYYGTSTTATLNGVTRTWVGGLGPVAGTESTQTLASTGAGQTLTYSVGYGLSYSYQGI